MADTPTLTEVLEEMVRDRIAAVSVSFPAKIQAVSADGKSVDVVPQMRQPIQREDGTFTSEGLPTLSQIPLATMRMGGFMLTTPAVRGGLVTVVVSDYDIGVWLATGEPGEPATPGCHVLSGAVALPYSAQPTGADVSSTDMEIGHDACLLQLSSARAAIGGDSDAAALASKVDLIDNAIRTAAVGVSDAGATYKANMILALDSFPAGPPWGSSASDKLKLGG